MIKKVKKLLGYLGGFQVSTQAASASFFIILSMPPLLTLVLSLLRYLPWDLLDLLEAVERVMPEALVSLAEYVLRDLYHSNLLTVVSVTVLAALWSASRGVYGILNGINNIMGGEEHRSYLRRRLSAILYTFLLIIALFLTLVLQVFGKSLVSMSSDWFPHISGALAELVRLRSLFTTAALALLFMMIFALFPARRMRLRDVVPGSLATAVGWMVFSYLFSIYVNYGGKSQVYGSMALAMLALLWLYICMCILFYGAVICRLTQEGQLNRRSLQKFLADEKK